MNIKTIAGIALGITTLTGSAFLAGPAFAASHPKSEESIYLTRQGEYVAITGLSSYHAGSKIQVLTNAPIDIQSDVGGRWHNVTVTKTNAKGAYQAKVPALRRQSFRVYHPAGWAGASYSVTKTIAAYVAPAVPKADLEALAAAKSYLSWDPLSRQGLIDQLDSPYGNGFSVAAATYAANAVYYPGLWNSEAVKAANAYLNIAPFSCSGLIAQLDSPYGSEFTVPQATYGADATGIC